MKDVAIELITEYAAEDADITYQLKQKLEPLVIDLNATNVFLKAEMPLVPVLADMEREGVKIDAQFLKQYSEEINY